MPSLNARGPRQRFLLQRDSKTSCLSVINQPELNQLVVSFGAGSDPEECDRLTLATVERIQQDAVAFMGAALWRGRWVMRVSVCSIATTTEHADITIAAVRDAWHKVCERVYDD